MAANRTILVIDNEADQLAIMDSILNRMGHAVTTADSPQAALDAVQRQAFDLILLDLIMPDVDGTELCEEIRQLQPDCRIFAFSGHVQLYDPQQLVRAGFDGSIRKPASFEEINAVLEQCDARVD
jgi:two-component system, OmpR family, lantibiotic biosynthesis response regulator NisR/SpaR